MVKILFLLCLIASPVMADSFIRTAPNEVIAPIQAQIDKNNSDIADNIRQINEKIENNKALNAQIESIIPKIEVDNGSIPVVDTTVY